MNNDNLHIDPALIARFLSGDISSEEHRQVLLWKESSPENRKQFDDFQEVWLMMDKTAPDHDIDIDAEWNHLQNTLHTTGKSTTKTISFRTVLSIAASVLVIIGLSFAGWMIYNHKSIESPIADTNHLILPDGSHVTLNAGSKLTYIRSGWQKSRIVSLEGEAFFEVTKNPKLPFVIRLGSADVKVLGTSFNVKAYTESENIEVTVAEGTVSVFNHQQVNKKVIVTRGEKAIFTKSSGEVIKKSNEDQNFIAWKTKLMRFENDSLPGIIKTLRSVYHRDIILQGKELNHCTITTTFDNKDLETVLRVLKSTLDISIEEKDGRILINGKGC
jgi:ferric-dicitrate binding protein FerR (iron transport regulator)